jgi:hypothetical protein
MSYPESLAPAISRLNALWSRFIAWVTREEHKQKAQELRDQVEKAFTDHPHATGETYLEHLWFTVRMTGRMLYSAIVILIHGIFPFLLTREASNQLEKIYRIMRSRIPEDRRSAIDTDTSWTL